MPRGEHPLPLTVRRELLTELYRVLLCPPVEEQDAVKPRHRVDDADRTIVILDSGASE